MGLRRLEQGNFTLLGMKYYVVFPQNNQGQSSFPKAEKFHTKIKCSSRCGPGYQTRIQICEVENGSGAFVRTSRSQCTGPRLKTETRPCRGTQCRRKHARHTPLWTTGNWQTVNIDKKYIFYSKNFTFAYLFLELHALVFFASSVFCGAFLYLVSKNEKRSEMASLRHTVVFQSCIG